MTNCPCDEPLNPALAIARALGSIPAGQSALPRQVRSFPEVREALLAGLPAQDALRLWRARSSQDLGLMLLEMWAYVSDVLSFYDERIANETYLRTAQRSVSLRRLVELLGYLPAPGIAGSVTLAALAEGRKPVDLPVGTAFRSDAFGAEPPQVFEITAPTSIHPFKNEWTIGPVQRGVLPQFTPTQIAETQNGNTPTIGEFLVFETLDFGLAVDRLVRFDALGSVQATKVAAILPFSGKDGKTYAEVRFEPSIELPDSVLITSVTVQVPTVTAVLSRLSPTTSGHSIVMTDGNDTLVYLDAVYRQLHRGDTVFVTDSDGALQNASVGDVEELPILVRAASGSGSNQIPSVTVPVTRLRLTGATVPSGTERNGFSFHFAFVDGGRVTTVADTELTPETLVSTPLPVKGVVERPPEVEAPSGSSSGTLSQTFLLTDPDGDGADVEGRMLFGASGRAQLFLSDQEDLPAPIYKTPITVFGNLVQATRGETVFNEVLGSGDSRILGQQFTLKKRPLTYLPSNNRLGRESTLILFVDGVRWKEVRTFFSCGPADRVYIVRHDEAQNTTITFGDGVRGARVPSGVNNVRATYRFGSGKASPPAGAIQQLARPVLGLRGVRSPIAAVEGKDPDPPERLRKDAPVSVRLLDRAISPQDFEALANLEPGVVRAVAEFVWIPSAQQAGVAVTYIGTRPPEQLKQALADRAELGLPIQVVQATAAAATLKLTIAADPDFEKGKLEQAIKDELLDPDTGLLAVVHAPIGGQFLVSPIYEAVHSVPGVVAVQSVSLDATNTATGQQLFEDFSLADLDMFCPIPSGVFLDFTGGDGVEIHFVDPVGPISASRRGGC